MKCFLERIFKFSLIGIFPFILLVIIYIILDPFKVIKSYETFYNRDDIGRVALNKDYVSTATFINNSKSIDYNSYIFGNSRSIFFQIDDWRKYLKPNGLKTRNSSRFCGVVACFSLNYKPQNNIYK